MILMILLQSQIKLLVSISLNQKTKLCKVWIIMAITAIFISIKHRFLNLRQLVIYFFISFVLEAIDINIIKSENELALDGKNMIKVLSSW